MSRLRGKRLRGRRKRNLGSPFPALAARPGRRFPTVVPSLHTARPRAPLPGPTSCPPTRSIGSARPGWRTNCPGKPASLEDAAPAPLKAEVRFSAPALRARPKLGQRPEKRRQIFFHISRHTSARYTWAHCNSSIRRPSSGASAATGCRTMILPAHSLRRPERSITGIWLSHKLPGLPSSTMWPFSTTNTRGKVSVSPTSCVTHNNVVFAQ